MFGTTYHIPPTYLASDAAHSEKTSQSVGCRQRRSMALFLCYPSKAQSSIIVFILPIQVASLLSCTIFSHSSCLQNLHGDFQQTIRCRNETGQLTTKHPTQQSTEAVLNKLKVTQVLQETPPQWSTKPPSFRPTSPTQCITLRSEFLFTPRKPKTRSKDTQGRGLTRTQQHRRICQA